MLKYSIYILALLSLSVFSCDPLDDLYDELDKTTVDPATVQELDIALTDDDYSSVDTIGSYFTSFKSAQEKIPVILNDLYPQLSEGSSANVSYNLYLPTSAAMVDTLTAADYEALGKTYGNFSSAGDIIAAAVYFMPAPAEGSAVQLTYDYYSGGTTTRDSTSVVAFYNGSWTIPYMPTAQDYKDMGQSYPNFEDLEEAKTKLAIKLGMEFPYAEADDFKPVYVAIYDGGTVNYLIGFTFDGTSWNGEQSLNLSKESDGTWVPNLSVSYTLLGSDYGFIANSDIGTAAGRTSVGQYSNFDLDLWSNDQLLAALNAILKKNFPNTEEGTQYAVTYATYNPAGSSTKVLVLTGGEYVEAEE